ncbi:MAG: hypothetical protein R3Y32_05990 [Bacillota bacterium]
MERKNMFFIVWLVVVFSSVVLIIYLLTSPVKEEESLDSATPAPTVLITASPSVDFSSEIPRTAQDSLNPNIEYTQILGGNGSDVLSGVITLDTYYLFGTTSSTSDDFSSGGDSDIFLAKIGMSGELLGTYTLQSDGDDVVIDAKPYSKLSESSKAGIAIVSQTEGETDQINITKISSDLASEYQTTIKFDGEVTVVSTIYSSDNLILHVNVEDGQTMFSEILKISYDLQEIQRIEITLTTQFKIVTGYSMGNTEILLINLFEDTQTSIGILEVDTQTQEKVLTRFSGDQTAVTMTPKSSGGFLIEYTYLDNSANKYGVMAVSSTYAIEFTHVVSGSDFLSVSVIEYYQNSNSTGYYIFATKKQNGVYETFSEYICTHGDLIYVDTSFLSDMLPKNFHISDSGMAVIGEVITESQTDIAMVSATTNGEVLRSETYGGTGEDAYVFSIINRYGNLDVFSSTLSSGGDIPYSFGKADIFMFEIIS